MKILRTVKEIQEYTREIKKAGKTIGLVPTMGALHEGHLTLMRAARQALADVEVARAQARRPASQRSRAVLPPAQRYLHTALLLVRRQPAVS